MGQGKVQGRMFMWIIATMMESGMKIESMEKDCFNTLTILNTLVSGLSTVEKV